MSDKAEWRDAVIRQRLLLFVDVSAVWPALHVHGGRISDIRRPETETDDYFAITAEGTFSRPQRHLPRRIQRSRLRIRRLLRDQWRRVHAVAAAINANIRLSY